MSPVGENIFVALKVGLADFRAQVEGAPGRKVRALGTASGTIPDLARKVLSAVADALAWLAGALKDAVDVLRVADALKALLEVATDLVGALATGLDFGQMPQKFGLDPRPFQAITDAANTGHSAMQTGVRIAGLVPAPEDLAGARQELELLLGHRANPTLTDAGALGKLLADITPRPH
jgi:hypothetical protein